jgi:hypothetical protein
MSTLNASPLHLISAIINLPQFHKDILYSPHEITLQCVRLLISLSEDEEYAYQSNVEMVAFLARTVDTLDDELYLKMNDYFVRRLLSVINPNDPIWGAISYVMASVVNVFKKYEEKEAWRRLCGLMFEVLRTNNIINPATASRILSAYKKNDSLQRDEAWELEKALSKSSSTHQENESSHEVLNQVQLEDVVHQDLNLLSLQSQQVPVSKDLDKLSSQIFDPRFEYKK